jgi:hypothetical protein
MKEIKYLKGGDITDPVLGDYKWNLIVHCCNSLGVMGAGVARALFMKWPQVRTQYLDAFELDKKCKLGEFHRVHIKDSLNVINMIGQEGIYHKDGIPPVRYEAFESTFHNLSQAFILPLNNHQGCIHVPYLMGCDLAGGEWDKVEALLIKYFSENDIQVIVYDLFNKREVPVINEESEKRKNATISSQNTTNLFKE